VDLFTEWREELDRILPDAGRHVEVDGGPEDLDFCTAFQIGAASAGAQWTDPGSEALVAIRLDLETGVLRVSYESPAFAELGKPGGDAAGR
jgi:hypothetical protein